MQREGIDFHNTFATVVNWSTVRLIIMMDDMDGWESRKNYYVLSLSQAPIYSDVYIHLLEGFHLDYEDKNETYFLKLKKDIFETRQA